ncbi:uncharacterized protein L969DRAFT_619951 [Mixia osmundae IAM 14324]|uniref:UDP-N-acetylglucosamine--dolichyl-phosphate N-acetylglucosaminephosphotransferase n=1 Tax=Mixia osmundae (strain CBS 9802 / IAM 14324 / JCM 22182 / KY 12970) TaxID=764103 RepID=G7E9Z4_MIXOS|nr:uncharacterized protein L969DRAFT_619951 [Mixia osmundae IAM 14324]KEI40097.1 hypothetical protein L969DRAFT_619951 [Mixia osmundae IAM 14324]GAA99463.1 hypothetical protein E5Q_06162 [Mixia osmundae IAM 14324]
MGLAAFAAENETAFTLLAAAALSTVGYVATSRLIPVLAQGFVEKGLSGIDMLKGYPRDQHGRLQGPRVPESTGVIGAAVYILLLSLFAPLPYYAYLLAPSDVSPRTQLVETDLTFPHHSLATYLASLLSLLTATFLGFLDDLFDIRWRYKLPIPIIASVPLLIVYIAQQGGTDVVLPKALGLRSLLGLDATGILKLGPLYYLYMSMLSTFCTNSINILAGVNGVEAGQALVIALSIAINDLLYLDVDIGALAALWRGTDPKTTQLSLSAGFGHGSKILADRHLFSLYFMLPLIAICLALLRHNWYPARSFVGDTFCYFAGMAFAVVGILGHFSKTLLLFFLPQVFNFVLSCPQLFGLVPCPRHRLPLRNAKTGKLEPSLVRFVEPPSLRARVTLSILSALGLVRLTRSKDGTILTSTNLTIISFVLVVAGPMREERLTQTIMLLQTACSVLAFAIRYGASSVFYDSSRR